MMITIAIITTIAAAAAIALVDFRDDLVEDVATTSVANESQTAVGVIVTPNLGIDSNSWVVSVDHLLVNVTNRSDNSGWDIIDSGQYNISTGIDGNGRLILTGNMSGNDTLISYTYANDTTAISITEVGLDAEDNTMEMMSTIGTIIGVALLLGLILGAFYLLQR
jgi:hypothetical protein